MKAANVSNLVYLNGDWVADENAKVSVFDRGFLFADGVYEVVPVYQRRPFLLNLHIQRLQRSAEAIGIESIATEFWYQLVSDLIHRNNLDDCLVYIQLTFGADSQRSHLPTQPLTPTIYASVSPLQVHWNTPTPVKVAVLEDIRWHRCDIKSISLLGNIMLKREAAKKGALEPLLHRNGRITEGASCNYFLVKQGALYTPPADHLILAGITRTWVIQLARQLGIEVFEIVCDVNQLQHADEVFLTSSSREVQPVGQIDDIIVGNGQCGVITAQIAEAFHASKRHLIQE
ncbi:MAG: hypothetical protein COA51_01735 [Idiomarina sp.]|nr:MAG: hypothetical protein COA51_01735 [Idiomarina sp.]